MAKIVKDKGTIRGFTVTSDGKRINAMIDDIIRRADKVAHDLHTTLVSIVLHVVKHGDCTAATRLAHSLDKGNYRQKAIAEWLMQYGPLTWTVQQSKDGKREYLFKVNTQARAEMLAEQTKDEAKFIKRISALETYWEFAPAPEFKGFDFMAKLGALMKEAEAYKSGAKGADLSDEDKAKVRLSGYDVIAKAAAKVA